MQGCTHVSQTKKKEDLSVMLGSLTSNTVSDYAYPNRTLPQEHQSGASMGRKVGHTSKVRGLAQSVISDAVCPCAGPVEDVPGSGITAASLWAEADNGAKFVVRREIRQRLFGSNTLPPTIP